MYIKEVREIQIVLMMDKTPDVFCVSASSTKGG